MTCYNTLYHCCITCNKLHIVIVMALVMKVLTDYDLGNMITLMLLLELNVFFFFLKTPLLALKTYVNFRE